MNRHAPLPAPAWVALVPPAELWRLESALEGSEGMPMDCPLYSAVMDRLWAEVGELISAWPVDPVGESDPGARLAVRFCGLAASPKDPNHRPARCLKRKSGYEMYSCSCGIRDGVSYCIPASWPKGASSGERIGKRWRAGGTWTWPIKLAKGKEFYKVCPDARGVDDPAHGLAGMGCICGRYKFMDDDKWKLIEVGR